MEIVVRHYDAELVESKREGEVLEDALLIETAVAKVNSYS